MQKRGLTIGVVAAVILILVIGLGIIANPNRHREAIQSQLEGRLGRKVTFGDMSLQLSPFGIRVADIAIAEDPAIGSSNFIHADALEVRAELWPLLQGRVNLDAVVLRRPKIGRAHV